MNAKKNVLGRGLGALIEDAGNKHDEGRFREIPLEHITANPYQPRTHFDEESLNELASSISRLGIVQPVTVRKTSDNEYQLISGERRYRASQIAGLTHIPAYVRESGDNEMLEMALVENIQREDLDAIEIALSYKRLIDECKLTQEEMSERVGKKRTTITNYLRLLKLPPEIQLGLRENKISMGHARAIISVEEPDTQLMLFEQILRYDFSVRRIEEIVRNLSNEQQEKPKQKKKMPSQKEVKKKISAALGCKVTINSREDGSGRISLTYSSEKEFKNLYEKLIRH